MRMSNLKRPRWIVLPLVAVAIVSLAVVLAVAAEVPGSASAQTGVEVSPQPQQPPTPTPVPPTDTPEPTPTPVVIVVTATPALPTSTPFPTYTPQPTYTPLPTHTLQPTYTPLPTPVPQQPANPYSGTTPFINCGPGEPCIDLHSSHTSITVNDKAQLSLSVVNALNKPNMTVRLILEVPSGWEVDGEGFAQRCSGICNEVYDVYTAQQELIQITAYPNHTGTFRIAGRIEWRYSGDANLYHITRDVQVRVLPGPNGNEQRSQPIPAFQVQPYVPAGAPPGTVPNPPPPANQQQDQVQQPPPPPQPESGVTGTAGCLAPAPDAPMVLDPTLLVVAGLILPGIAARLGFKARRKREKNRDIEA